MDPDDQSNIPQNKYPIRVQVVGASGEQITSFGGGSGGGAVTIANGADVTEGALADAAVTAGSTGSVSGKLRQISSDIGTIQTRTPALGQALAASSVPVVLTAAQISTLTPPAALTGYALDATLTGGTQQTKITDGTNVGGILKNDGTIASTQNALLVGGTGYTTATVSLSAGSPNSAWFDMLNYAWLSVEILTNTTPATLTFQTSGDAAQTNINSVQLMSAGGTAPSTTSTSAVATFHGPRTGRYFRVSSNLAGGNTATMVFTFFTNPAMMPAIYATQTGTWSVGSSSVIGAAVPANAFTVGAQDSSGNLAVPRALTQADTQANTTALVTNARLQIYNGTNNDMAREVVNATNSTGTGILAAGILAQLDDTSPTAITENQFGNLRMTTARSLMVENRYTYGRVTADGQIGTSAKFIHTVSIAPTGSVTAGVLTIYDNTAESGTVIYSVALPVTTFTPFTVKLDVDTTTGIYVGFDATLANVQATVSYR